MKVSIPKSLLYSTLSIGMLFGCINDDDYDIPYLQCIDPKITANKTTLYIYNKTTTAVTPYPADDVIEAYVISSDKEGNYLKTLHLQTLDHAIGFTVLVDYSNLATLYQPGRKIIIKMQGLYTQIRNNELLIGVLNENNLGRISLFDTPKVILRNCSNPIDEEQLVEHISIAEAISSDIYLNKLVVFDKVQFKDTAVGKPYYVANSKSTSHSLIDERGNEIKLRSTIFTKFGSNIISEKSGKIKGILKRLGTTYQCIPRFESDIQLIAPRFYVNTALKK